MDIENFTGIQSLWKWSENSWKVWSPDDEMLNLLMRYNIEIIDKIKQGEGFWINK